MGVIIRRVYHYIPHWSTPILARHTHPSSVTVLCLNFVPFTVISILALTIDVINFMTTSRDLRHLEINTYRNAMRPDYYLPSKRPSHPHPSCLGCLSSLSSQHALHTQSTSPSWLRIAALTCPTGQNLWAASIPLSFRSRLIRIQPSCSAAGFYASRAGDG